MSNYKNTRRRDATAARTLFVLGLVLLIVTICNALGVV
jgi:uncharacterized membrane protein YtjA (UPF0391 family)